MTRNKSNDIVFIHRIPNRAIISDSRKKKLIHFSFAVGRRNIIRKYKHFNDKTSKTVVTFLSKETFKSKQTRKKYLAGLIHKYTRSDATLFI